MDIELEVFLTPKNIQLTMNVDIVTTPDQVNINCSVTAVPKADLYFYYNDIRNIIYSSKESMVLSILNHCYIIIYNIIV